VYGDPTALLHRARELDDRVEDLLHSARTMRTRAARTAWVGIAAQAHRDAVDQAARRLERAAARLAEAAEALRDHVRELRHRLAAIEAAEAIARMWFHAAQSWLSAGAHAVVDGVRHLLGSGPVPPWHGWRWTPTTLPPLGHLDWIDVADHVRTSSWRP
jgi:chromosome segregation ATPase